MRFYIRKRRQAPAIIIVALVDILIVLLIYLMVTTTFKQQPALRLALPESSQAQKSGARENAPMVVIIDAKGNLRYGPEAKPVTVDHLKEELVAAIAKTPELKVAISADKAAPFGQFIKVKDAVSEVGIKQLTVFTKEPGKP
jgi:biopolymer transport protein ExbD